MQQTVDNVIAVHSYPSSAEERPDSLAMQFLHSEKNARECYKTCDTQNHRMN